MALFDALQVARLPTPERFRTAHGCGILRQSKWHGQNLTQSSSRHPRIQIEMLPANRIIMKKCFRCWIATLAFGLTLAAHASEQWVELAGQWEFALDHSHQGFTWARTNLLDTIRLPGTTDENHKGTLNDAKEPGRLTRIYPYSGPAWYRREFRVPRDWSGKVLFLFLERTKHTALWLDDRPLGTQDSLVAPHVYELGTLAPGPHQITLCVDNGLRPPVGDPHQLSDQTQTDWNGIIGKIGLRIADPVWIEGVQAYPDLARREVHVRIELGNATHSRQEGTLDLHATITRGTGHPPDAQHTRFVIETNRQTVELDYVLGQNPVTWDEFQPGLYRLTVTLAAGKSRDEQSTVFGVRELDTKGTQLKINGRTTFLRGRHDACVFPLTGYPPMDVPGWRRVLGIAQSYGLNLIRFHTWCPPDAAFTAADELGVYLQPELPNWHDYGGAEHDEYLRAEGARLLRQFGNHPSFLMLSLGNELGGSQQTMAPLVREFKSLDRRHLYAEGSNNWFGDPGEDDDYYCSFQYHWQHIRGSFATVDKPPGSIQTGPPNTLKDYSREIAGLKVPVISHEVGQYQVAPDFREISRYTGVLRARNFELFRDRMQSHGLLAQADDFVRASGATSLLCYREEIELALRTPGFGGFHLLDLMDFPGQGTALVGMLNAFMESKGIVEPEPWREFCSPTVPLLRLSRYVWTQDEAFTARAQIAHYGAADLAAQPEWVLRDAQGKPCGRGALPPRLLPQGTLTDVGEIRIPLNQLAAPGKFTIEVSLAKTAIRNHYDIWVYPASPGVNPGKVRISRELDLPTRDALAQGSCVLLLPEPASLTNSIPGSFAPDFWNFGMFEKLARERKAPVAPGTLGVFIDSKHPALAGFPTGFHGDWQWFNLLLNSRALILDSWSGFRPIVQVIDNYERAHRLGTVLEAKVGPGKLLLCAIDLPALQDKPEARQLLSSLLRYMNSPKFNPAEELTVTQLESVLK